jgi:diacylglycerol kinase
VQSPERPNSTWPQKFRCAFRGIIWAIRCERSFAVHCVMAVAVIAAAAFLRPTRLEWCLLLLCISTVLAAELFNSALEHLARAVTRERNEDIRNALDTSAGAVLVVAIGPALAGSAIFFNLLTAR